MKHTIKFKSQSQQNIFLIYLLHFWKIVFEVTFNVSVIMKALTQNMKIKVQQFLKNLWFPKNYTYLLRCWLHYLSAFHLQIFSQRN